MNQDDWPERLLKQLTEWNRLYDSNDDTVTFESAIVVLGEYSKYIDNTIDPIYNKNCETKEEKDSINQYRLWCLPTTVPFFSYVYKDPTKLPGVETFRKEYRKARKMNHMLVIEFLFGLLRSLPGLRSERHQRFVKCVRW
jgi:hypothetical protein